MKEKVSTETIKLGPRPPTLAEVVYKRLKEVVVNSYNLFLYGNAKGVKNMRERVSTEFETKLIEEKLANVRMDLAKRIEENIRRGGENVGKPIAVLDKGLKGVIVDQKCVDKWRADDTLDWCMLRERAFANTSLLTFATIESPGVENQLIELWGIHIEEDKILAKYGLKVDRGERYVMDSKRKVWLLDQDSYCLLCEDDEVPLCCVNYNCLIRKARLARMQAAVIEPYEPKHIVS